MEENRRPDTNRQDPSKGQRQPKNETNPADNDQSKNKISNEMAEKQSREEIPNKEDPCNGSKKLTEGKNPPSAENENTQKEVTKSTTIEKVLQELNLDEYIDLFQKQEITLELLLGMANLEMGSLFHAIGVAPVGRQWKIIKKIEKLKADNKISEARTTKSEQESVKVVYDRIPKETNATTNASEEKPSKEAMEMLDGEKFQNEEDSSEVSNTFTSETHEIRLVLLGKTGSGKSATANTILGETHFESMVSGKSVTHHCLHHSKVRFGSKLVIVDTPGIFDTEDDNDKTQEEIFRCIGLTSPGPHAFILVISVAARYTEEEHRSVEHFIKYFGENIYKYFIILFTRKDELPNNARITDHIKEYPAKLINFIHKCGGRICAFNNMCSVEEKDRQVKQLLRLVDENLKILDGKNYTNEMYEEAEKKIKQEEEERTKKLKEIHEKEIQAIKDQLADDFNKNLAKEKEHIDLIQNQLRHLTREQKTKDDHLTALIKQMSENKKNQPSVEAMQDELEHLKRQKEELEREQIKMKQEYQKKLNDLESEHKQIIKNIKDILQEQMRKEMRDEIREQLEKSKEPSSKCTIL